MANYMLQYKESGFCRALVGNIGLYAVFIDSRSSSWTREHIESARVNMREAVDFLRTEAKRDRIKLAFSYHDELLAVNNASESVDDMMQQFVENKGYKSVSELSGHIRKTEGVESTVFMLLLNQAGRSSMRCKLHHHANIFENNSFLVIYEHIKGVYLHEMLHLFGAADYYYPEAVMRAANQLFPNSTMLESENLNIDSLTKYLVGWVDKPSPDAEKLLFVAKQFSEADISKEKKLRSDSDYAVIVHKNGTYYGPIKNGFRNGRGKFRFNDGAYCEGLFLNGNLQGECYYRYKDGSVYLGSFVAGVREGVGTLTYASGNVLKCTFKGGEANGKGVLRFKSGSVLECTFVNGEATGQGALKYANGNIYKGGFVAGVREGVGTLTYASGNVLKCTFKGGEANGKGVLRFKSGSVLECTFVNGEATGQGALKYANGNIYKGGFVAGVREGVGTLTYASGNVLKCTFKGGEANGKGMLKFKSGSVLECTFVNGEATGQGVLKYANGDVYKGGIRNGSPNGFGVVELMNGKVLKGRFENGKLGD